MKYINIYIYTHVYIYIVIHIDLVLIRGAFNQPLPSPTLKVITFAGPASLWQRLLAGTSVESAAAAASSFLNVKMTFFS